MGGILRNTSLSVTVVVLFIDATHHWSALNCPSNLCGVFVAGCSAVTLSAALVVYGRRLHSDSITVLQKQLVRYCLQLRVCASLCHWSMVLSK